MKLETRVSKEVGSNQFNDSTKMNMEEQEQEWATNGRNDYLRAGMTIIRAGMTNEHIARNSCNTS